MKRFIRLYDDDLRDILTQYYQTDKEKVTSIYTDECINEGTEDEHYEPIYYIEVEWDGGPSC